MFSIMYSRVDLACRQATPCVASGIYVLGIGEWVERLDKAA